MSDKTYVDPNSGAAPQPGGYAGAAAAEKGFTIPSDFTPEKQEDLTTYEAPGGNPVQKTVSELVEQAQASNEEGSEVSDEERQRIEALSNPHKVLAELSDGAVEVPEPGQEEQAVDDASLEHQGIEPGAEVEETEESDDDESEESGDESYDPSQYGVAEVNEYLAANPDQRDAVVAAERAGKNRKTITGDE